MPQLIVPIITAVAGAFSVGEGIYSLTSQPGAPKTDPTAQQNAVNAQALQDKQAQEAANKQAAIKAAPDAQALTGGALTDAGFSDLVARLINQPGDTSNIQAALFGGSGGESGGTSSGASGASGPRLADIPDALNKPIDINSFSLAA